MLPYVHLINRDVPVYGLLMALGGLLGWLLCQHRAQRFAPQLPRESVTRFYLLFLAGALIGAKVYSLILVWPSLMENRTLLWTNPPLFLQMYIYGGMVFYGGLIGGILCAAGLLLSGRIRFPQLEVVYLPVIPLVHGIGRIGCFCAGCCYGIPTDGFWGVTYPLLRESLWCPSSCSNLPAIFFCLFSFVCRFIGGQEAGWPFICWVMAVYAMLRNVFAVMQPAGCWVPCQWRSGSVFSAL